VVAGTDVLPESGLHQQFRVQGPAATLGRRSELSILSEATEGRRSTRSADISTGTGRLVDLSGELSDAELASCRDYLQDDGTGDEVPQLARVFEWFHSRFQKIASLTEVQTLLGRG
jgi:hypothetical protein